MLKGLGASAGHLVYFHHHVIYLYSNMPDTLQGQASFRTNGRVRSTKRVDQHVDLWSHKVEVATQKFKIPRDKFSIEYQLCGRMLAKDYYFLG